MTREEAISQLISLNEEDVSIYSDAVEYAIKALEQEPVLNKIRAEIESLTYYWCEVHPKTVIDDVLEIIDKYKEG